MIFLFIVLLVLLIGSSAFLAASETALFSLSPFLGKAYKQDVDLRKQIIGYLLEKPRELLVTILMLNVLFNILVQNVVSNLFGEEGSWYVKVGIPLLLTLFFGEILPKSMALHNNALIAYRVSPLISRIFRWVGPVRNVLTTCTSYLSRFLFFFLKKEKPLSNEELEFILDTSEEKGILYEEESELIRGCLELKDSIVKEHMRPRDEILFYTLSQPIDHLVSLFVEQKCSRVPVCEKDIDSIIGVLSVRQFLLHKEKIVAGAEVKKFLRKPLFIPDSTNSFTLLQQMRSKREHIGLVVNEYGSIFGLITQEDLIEAVVGEIQDLRDEKKKYTRADEEVLIASGKMELDEFEEIFGVSLERKSNVVTIGGWLMEQLEAIPQSGMKYETKDFLFYVLAAEPNRVKRVYIRKIGKKG